MLQKKYPDIDTPSLIVAALYQREGNEKKSTESLDAYKQKFPNKSEKIGLTMAQLLCSKKVR